MLVTIDDAYCLLGAVVRRALVDVRSGTPTQRADAESFLDWICPHWQSWPARHQELAATISAQRRAAVEKRHRNGQNFSIY